MKKTLLSLTISLLSLTAVAQTSVYSFSAIDNEGKTISLNEYRGKVLLIVNTATRCGFTPQYKELEDLYKQYHTDGLEILDFPCNQLGSRHPVQFKRFTSSAQQTSIFSSRSSIRLTSMALTPPHSTHG